MKFAIPAVAALVALHAVPAAAQESAAPSEQEREWAVTLGASAVLVPEYEGSEDYEVIPYPIVDVVWRDRLFLSSRRGAGAYLWNDDGIKLGASIGYAFGRDDDDGPLLEGLGDVDGGATVNLFASYEFAGFDLSSRFTHQFTGDDTGYVVDVGVGYTFRLPPGVIVKPSLSTEYASDDHMEAYFGISPSQSVRSGNPVHDADAGFKNVGPELLVVFPLDENVSLQGTASYKRLLGDAEDSPITEDADQFSLGVGVAYRF